MKAVILVLTIAANAAPIHRWIVPTAYTSAPVAQASYNPPSMLISTGLADYPVIQIQIIRGDLIAFQPNNPAHVQEFPVAQIFRAMMTMRTTHARAKGIVTTQDNTIIVWWIE